MPVLDGLEAARRIRRIEDPEKASIPIIAVSANVHEKERREALEAGMNAFAEKPIFIDRLFAAMAKFL
jgi:CheY-like chemotaxis protein